MRRLGEAAGRVEGLTAPALRAALVAVFGYGGGMVTQGVVGAAARRLALF